jgi:5-formyltetrahydrofolate cyclo-ligase
MSDVPRHCQHCPQRAKVEREGGDCPSSPQRKAELRRAVTASLSAMTPEVRRKKSELIVRRVLELEEFKRAHVVMAYVALELEVDPWLLVRESWALGKVVALPRIEPPLPEPRATYMHNRQIVPFELKQEPVDDPHDHGGLRADAVGILEPKADAAEIPVGEIGLVVVPTVAFDRRGCRLGKGGGFYDRFLARADLKAALCGLAFSEQVFAGLPVCPHDRPVDLLVTEAGVMDFRRKDS